MQPEDIPITCRYFQEGWGINNMDHIYHVIPANELDQHVPSIKCNCNPVMEIIPVESIDRYVVLHNSFLLMEIAKANSN